MVAAWKRVKANKGGAGVDGRTVQDTGKWLENAWPDIRTSLLDGSYRPTPVRRVGIPKSGGGTRELGIPTVVDRLIQQALLQVLQALIDPTFSTHSHGFRPGRSAHGAVLEAEQYVREGYRIVVDVDLEKFFDGLSQEWLIRFLEHRIGDERVIRLVRKWLRAGVLEEGEWSVSEKGTPQGAVASPLLANVYLHYVFDLWAHQWRRREAIGNVVVVRYADDIVVGFEREADAKRFWDAMRTRLGQFELELHGEKTRLLEFGRHAAAGRRRRGLGKPETFTFLGFTFICGKSRGGAFLLHRKTRRDRMTAKLRDIKEDLRRRMHTPITGCSVSGYRTTCCCGPQKLRLTRTLAKSSTSTRSRLGYCARIKAWAIPGCDSLFAATSRTSQTTVCIGTQRCW